MPRLGIALAVAAALTNDASAANSLLRRNPRHQKTLGGDPDITHPTLSTQCPFGKCGEDSETNICYEWTNRGPATTGDDGKHKHSTLDATVLQCDGHPFTKSAWVRPVAVGSTYEGASSTAPFTIENSDQCAYYYKAGSTATTLQKLTPGMTTEATVPITNWAYLKEVSFHTYPTRYSDVEEEYVDVTHKFYTVPMNGCSIVATWDTDHWKAVHLASRGINIAQASGEPVAVVFPQVKDGISDDDMRVFWLWGEMKSTGNNDLVIYAGALEGSLSKVYTNNLGVGPTFAKVQAAGEGTGAITAFSSCKKITFKHP